VKTHVPERVRPITETTNRDYLTETTRNKIIEQKLEFGEFENVFLTSNEYKKLIDSFGEAGTRMWIEKISAWMKSSGKRKKDHYATILVWSKREPIKQGAVMGDPDKYIKGRWGHVVRR
jgi:PleD family two-component response regulator